jgi:hypothetical protein
MKIDYNLSKQEKNYFCVPAIFQAILRRHGFEKSQEELAASLNCQPVIGTLITPSFYELFLPYGLTNKFTRSCEVTMGEPLFLMDEWAYARGDLYIFSENPNGQGHARLALDFDGKKLLIRDPANLSETAESLEDLFARISHTKLGGFGIIKKLDKPQMRLLTETK